MKNEYDVVVVGSGHAAVEAALAASRLSQETLMITLDPNNVSGMPCNPSIGGPGKAQIVSEIDALGGEMAMATDFSTIELRLLNSSKGPAVQSLRAQVDKRAYSEYMKGALKEAGIRLERGLVTGIIVDNGKVRGVRVDQDREVFSSAVIIATGVYLESRIIIGDEIIESGPIGEPSAKGLSKSLMELGFKLGRFKTGTSPRIDGSTIDWDLLKKEEGVDRPYAFSFMSVPRVFKKDVCYSTYTTPLTHDIIRKNIHRAPLFDGTIEGVGPRYCPSIEDKVMRFPNRARHQVYLERESLKSNEVYILGLSTSLPVDVQEEIVHSLDGLRNAKITRPGYAIEYDYLLSSQITPTLALAGIEGLYTAGQINGTSGYEEAAAQGLIAGINASLELRGVPGLVLDRDQAYIGVLVDDIVGKDIQEPYRMLTARAEYRLLLRQSNADSRLTPIGREIGLVGNARWQSFVEKSNLLKRGRQAIAKRVKGGVIADLLRQPKRSISDFFSEAPELKTLPPAVLTEVEIEAKYSGFIARQEREARRLSNYAQKRIPQQLEFASIPGISKESIDKLTKFRPSTIAKALAVGVSPQDVLILLAFLKHG
jgi:tRNA uridine 5-carboxymethylaminomethyl modification enzyme